ncbi:unnamed protein product, partial [Ectocarpus sp. 8 AP-2014]
GLIPKELGALSKLKRLSLGGNRLTGPIHPELGKLGALKILDLSINRLDGAIPPELGDLRELQTLRLNNNQLTGPIPKELGALSKLERLSLGKNALTGEAPKKDRCLQVLTPIVNLCKLYTHTGSVPAHLLKLVYLVSVELRGNKFSGPAPSVKELNDLRRAVVSSGDKCKGMTSRG